MEKQKLILKTKLSKGFTVRQVTNNSMSRHTFTRFINGETDIRLSYFLIIIENLNLSYNEVLDDISFCPKNKFMQQLDYLKILVLNDDNKTILKLAAEYSSVKIISHFLKSLTKYNTHSNKLIVINYLLNIETWTSFELSLFIFINAYFSKDFNLNFIQNLERKISKNQEGKIQYEKEYFSILISIAINYLVIDPKLCLRCLKLATPLGKSDFYIIERLLINFCNSFVLADSIELKEKQIEKYSKIFANLECSCLSYYLSKIKTN